MHGFVNLFLVLGMSLRNHLGYRFRILGMLPNRTSQPLNLQGARTLNFHPRTLQLPPPNAFKRHSPLSIIMHFKLPKIVPWRYWGYTLGTLIKSTGDNPEINVYRYDQIHGIQSIQQNSVPPWFLFF